MHMAEKMDTPKRMLEKLGDKFNRLLADGAQAH